MISDDVHGTCNSRLQDKIFNKCCDAHNWHDEITCDVITDLFLILAVESERDDVLDVMFGIRCPIYVFAVVIG